VNRPDYFFDDPRKNPKQEAMCHDAEQFILRTLSLFLKPTGREVS
jgi:hypothetical protein